MHYRTQNLVIRPVTEEDVDEVARMWNFEKGEITRAEALKAIEGMAQNHQINERAIAELHSSANEHQNSHPPSQTTAQPHTQTNDQANNRPKNHKTLRSSLGHACFAIFEDQTNRIIGWCGLDGRSGDQVNIFYLIDKAFRRQGYATICAQKMLDYGFRVMHIDRIDGECASDNIGSQKILERLGMVKISDNSKAQTREESLHYFITHLDYMDKSRA